MSFTIEVEPVKSHQDFSISDLKLHHAECGGGLISGVELSSAAVNAASDLYPKEESSEFWRLQCTRCGVRNSISVSEAGTALIAKTALDGEERSLAYDCETKVRPGHPGPVIVVRHRLQSE